MAGPSGQDNNYTRNGPAIWMAGDGPAADSSGNVYFLTGNGRFETTLDANGFPNQGDYGNSFVKLSSAGGNLAVADYFASFDALQLSSQDTDLGSGGEMLLPDLTDSTNTTRHLVVGAGKDGKIYVVDRDNMGKYNSTKNNIWQEVDGALGGAVFALPCVLQWQSVLRRGQRQPESLQHLQRQDLEHGHLAVGGNLQLSGNLAGGFGERYDERNRVGTREQGRRAVLHAYDASNLATELSRPIASICCSLPQGAAALGEALLQAREQAEDEVARGLIVAHADHLRTH